MCLSSTASVRGIQQVQGVCACSLGKMQWGEGGAARDVGGKQTFGSICDKNTLAIRLVQQISLQGLESTVFVIL